MRAFSSYIYQGVHMTLYEAIIRGDLEEVKRILVRRPNVIDERVNGEWLPYVAARGGNFEIVRYMVEYSRASFNLADEEGKNMLHHAVVSGNVELVKYLVERVGISPLVGDYNCVTPFELSHKLNLKNVEEYFENYCGVKLENMYKNPIRTGMYPDPSIVCVGEDFYMVNSSFVFFPCIPISHSKDLIHWEVIGHAITNPEWSHLRELEGGRGYWAPDISYDCGKFYITATYRLNDNGTVYRRQIVVSSERPEGPYCEPAYIEEDGIDPSIFTDDDGKRYMILNRGARIFEISKDGKKQLSEASLLFYGDMKRAPEGSHLLKKDGYYYLFQAEGGTGIGHRITVSRSNTLFGTYTPCPYNPIMRQKDEKAAIQRCGHGKPVKTPNGEWFMVYLCGRYIDGEYTMLGRETAIDPIRWTSDGWPIVNELKGPSVLQKKPNLSDYEIKQESDNFCGNSLGKQWITPREPEPDAFRVSKGFLWLKSSKEDLSLVSGRNILLRRQEHFSFEATATMILPKLEFGQEAGMTCYYDENTYLTFSVVVNDRGPVLQVKEHIDDTNRYHGEIKVSGDKIIFKIITKGLERSFYYTFDKESQKHLCTLEKVDYLCDEGSKRGKRFTGAMVGLYAYAAGKEPFCVAYERFRYKPKNV